MRPDLRSVQSAARRVAAVSALAALAACGTIVPPNAPIAQVDPEAGYRVSNVFKAKHVREAGNQWRTLFVLTFSGGGTRAAALSYGVLEELRRTELSSPDGTRHSLLAEVDLISGVSGGSFTALAYALYGERLFGEYESRFLKRDVQGTLAWRALSPANWFRLAHTDYGRSELAADYYDEILFGGATFNDLLGRPAPMAVVSGTDLSTGARFQFTQDQFDLMCSDLGTVRLARAAATSSAVPVVLTPVTYRNYGGQCGARMPAWVGDIVRPDDAARPAGRALLRYRDIQSIQDSRNRPYLHVVDGGVSDNLGLRGVIEGLEEVEASPAFRQALDFRQLRRIVVVVVNSRSAPATDWDRSPSPPGLVSQLLQSSSVPIDHFSYESVELLKDIARRWADARRLEVDELRLNGLSAREAQARVPQLAFDAIDVSFDAIEDPAERRYFMDLPTSFVLPHEAVDRLRALGARLLRASPAYRGLLAEMQPRGAAATSPAPGAR